MVDVARSQQAEFFADTILRLQAAKKIQGRDSQVQALEDAYRAAASARSPMRAATVSLSIDNEGVFVAMAANLRLDAVSIRIRVIREMAAVDKARARAMLEELMPPAVPASECASSLVYDPAEFYELLLSAQRLLYDKTTSAQRSYADLLRRHTMAIQHPAQATGVARVLAAVEIHPDELALLLTVFNQRLAESRADNRSFGYLWTQGRMGEAISALLKRVGEAGLEQASTVQAFEKLLLFHLSQPRCSAFRGSGGDALSKIADEFNSGFRRLAPNVDPIPAEIARAAKIVDSERAGRLEYPDWLSGCLLRRPNGPWGREETPTDWEKKADACAQEIVKWRESDQMSKSALLHMRCKVLVTLLDSAQGSFLYSRLASAYIHLMEESSIRRDRPAEWLLNLRQYLNLTRQPDKEVQAEIDARLAKSSYAPLLPHADREKLRSLLEQSPDPVIHLYLELDRQCPEPFVPWWSRRTF